jgi:hypothetical protein
MIVYVLVLRKIIGKGKDTIMSGTPQGAAKARATIKKRYGKTFYARIGAIGGKNSTTGGFGAGEAGRERARKYGRIGGRVSRRRKTVSN